MKKFKIISSLYEVYRKRNATSPFTNSHLLSNTELHHRSAYLTCLVKYNNRKYIVIYCALYFDLSKDSFENNRHCYILPFNQENRMLLHNGLTYNRNEGITNVNSKLSDFNEFNTIKIVTDNIPSKEVLDLINGGVGVTNITRHIDIVNENEVILFV